MAENISELLPKILSEWNFSVDAVSGVTTDNGSNIVWAISLTEWMQLLCFSHTLQLSVEKAMALIESTCKMP